MTEHARPDAVLRALVGAACFVIVVAGLHAASIVVVPVLLAAFLAIIIAPPFLRLQRRGVPTIVALVLLAAAVVLVSVIVSAVIGTSFQEFREKLPEYEDRWHEIRHESLQLLERFGVHLQLEDGNGELTSDDLLNLVQQAFSAVGGVLTAVVIVFFTLLFALLEAAGFPTKLKALHRRLDGPPGRYAVILSGVRRYLVIKSLVSLLTGALIYVVLLVFGLDFPILWAFVAFLFNFVPNVGSLVAAVPAVFLALVQLGPVPAAGIGLGYLVVNLSCGNFLEPRWMGYGLGLSPLVVFLSLLFWGFALGPMGMFLAVPLTMTAKITLEATEETRWIATLLGPNATPPEEQQNESGDG